MVKDLEEIGVEIHDNEPEDKCWTNTSSRQVVVTVYGTVITDGKHHFTNKHQTRTWTLNLGFQKIILEHPLPRPREEIAFKGSWLETAVTGVEALVKSCVPQYNDPIEIRVKSLQLIINLLPGKE
jgi:hypothetical protein